MKDPIAIPESAWQNIADLNEKAEEKHQVLREAADAFQSARDEWQGAADQFNKYLEGVADALGADGEEYRLVERRFVPLTDEEKERMKANAEATEEDEAEVSEETEEVEEVVEMIEDAEIVEETDEASE